MVDVKNRVLVKGNSWGFILLIIQWTHTQTNLYIQKWETAYVQNGQTKYKELVFILRIGSRLGGNNLDYSFVRYVIWVVNGMLCE